MNKYSFLDDYSEGCHPLIMQALSRTNLVQQTSYGNDEYSHQAKALIQQRLHSPEADIYFVSTGTQANLIVISSMLRSHEAVISAATGHILVRETGAIEATGHQIISVKTDNGKLTLESIQAVLDEYTMVPPHMVKPKLVYISNATETGTIYSKAELTALYHFCQAKNLYLFLDGARLGSALCSDNNDIIFEDLPKLTDVFYIGGTKNGALIGEAIVINNPHLKEDFAFHIKQRGALLSKGRLLGIQFLELFKDNLYFELPSHANSMAKKLAIAFADKGYHLPTETETNQVFITLPNSLIETLQQKFAFYIWQKVENEHSVVRFVTLWATDEKKVDELIEYIA